MRLRALFVMGAVLLASIAHAGGFSGDRLGGRRSPDEGKTGNTTPVFLDGPINRGSLHYIGAIKVPIGDYVDSDAEFYSANSACYSPDGATGADATDGFPGTIWIHSGHPRIGQHCTNCPGGGYIGQIGIPAPVVSTSTSNLPTAVIYRHIVPPDTALYHLCELETCGIGLGQNQLRTGQPFWIPQMGIMPEPTLFFSYYFYYPSIAMDLDKWFAIGTSINPATRSNHYHCGPHTVIQGFGDDWDPMKTSQWKFLIPYWWMRENLQGFTGFAEHPASALGAGEGGREGAYTCTNPGGPCPNPSGPPWDAQGRRGGNIGPGLAFVNPREIVWSSHAEGYEIPARIGARYITTNPTNVPLLDPPFNQPYVFSAKDEWLGAAWIANYPFDMLVGNPLFFAPPIGHQDAVVYAFRHCLFPTWYLDQADACGHSVHGYLCGRQDLGNPLPCWQLELWFVNPQMYADVLNGSAANDSPTAYSRCLLTRDDGSPLFFQDLCAGIPGFGLDTEGPGMGNIFYDSAHGLLGVLEQGAYKGDCCQRGTVIHFFRILFLPGAAQV